MGKCEIEYCPSFSKEYSSYCGSTDNVELCEARKALIENKEIKIEEMKKCDNDTCNYMIVKGEGKMFQSMSTHSNDIKTIELCNECAEIIMKL